MMTEATDRRSEDDPRRGHPDVRTELKDVSYFFLGNGLIQAAVQFAPGGEGTALGLLVMNPERLGKKREALTMDPAAGLEPTVVRLVTRHGEGMPGADLRVEWSEHHGAPTVLAHWTWHAIDVRERFFCPDCHTPRLVREIDVRPSSGDVGEVRLVTGGRGASVERLLALHAGTEARTWIVYSLDAAGRRVHEATTGRDPLEQDARRFWTGATHASFGDSLVDRWFCASRWQLPAVVSAHGCVDSSIWQNNREEVPDQALVALALVTAGHHEQAAVIFRRLLRGLGAPDGAIVDSSDRQGFGGVGLGQNAVLLDALHQYVRWTGDLDLVASSRDRIAALGGSSLRPESCTGDGGLPYGSGESRGRQEIDHCHVDSDAEPPDGRPPAALCAARAALQAGHDDTVWRVLRWLDTVPGAAAGSWFESYGSRVVPPSTQVGVVPTTWAEMMFLLVHDVLGVRPADEMIRLKPRLPAGLQWVKASIPVRRRRLRLEVRAFEGLNSAACRMDGRPVDETGGTWLIPCPSDDLAVEIEIPASSYVRG